MREQEEVISLWSRVRIVGIDRVEGDVERLLHGKPPGLAQKGVVKLLRELLRRLI